MKKLLFLIVAVLLVMRSVAFADNTQLADYKYMIVNDSGDKLFTAIPTSVINPTKHRILKFTVGPYFGERGSLHTESVACIYDATTVGAATNKVAEGEIESNDTDSVFLKYERPLNLINGVVIGQGASTIVLIEWEYKY